MTILDPSPRPARDGRDAAKPDPRAGTLTLPGTFTAARLKVTTMLDAAELNAIKAPKGNKRQADRGKGRRTNGD
jgi:hypothetical protein